MPGSFESLSTMPSAFALVIAIDKYKKNGIPPLSGCVNDAEDFQTFLTKTLKLPSDNIRTLFDDAATRDNILKEFDEHLIRNQKIHTDDLIFFYYAGHGDRVDAPRDWSSPEGMVETICPVDLTAFEDESSATQGVIPDETPLVHGIPDRTFHALMRQVAEVKGNNIVAVFDCCHSGGMARGLDTGVRALPDHGPLLSKRLRLPEDLDAAIINRTPDSLRGRNISFEAYDGFSHSGTTSHVLLAACQPKEKALEYTPDGSTTRGRFTDNLLGHLRDAVKDNSETKSLRVSYADLVNIVAGRLKSTPKDLSRIDPSSQQPHCEGYHKDRFLFSKEGARASDTVTLSYGPIENGENAPCVLFMKRGSIHGVVKGKTGTRLSAVPSRPATNTPANDTTPNTTPNTIPNTTPFQLYTARVEPFWSELVIDGSSEDRAEQVANLKLLDRAVATVSAWNTKPMKVCTTQDVPVGSFKIVKTKSSDEYADISYDPSPPSPGGRKGYRLTRHDPLITCFAQQTLLVNNIDSRVLDDIARFNFYLYHYNPSQRIREDLSIQVQFHRLKTLEDGRLKPKLVPADDGSKDLFTTEKRTLSADPQSAYQLCDGVKEAIITDLSPYYHGLTLINESEVDIFPYVFYFDPGDYSITAWYLPPSEKLEQAPLHKQKWRLEIGYGENTDQSIQFSLKKSVEKESGFLKVFTSTSYVNMKPIIQASPWSNNRGPGMVPVPPNPGWSSSTYVLTARHA